MKQIEKLKLIVNDYRAVESATIEIGDISVLSGVNACGKSTIAHLFHSIINLNRDYKKLALELSWLKVERVFWCVRQFRIRLLDALGVEDPDYKRVFKYDELDEYLRPIDNSFEQRVKKLYDNLDETFDDLDKLSKQDGALAKRLFRSFAGELATLGDQDVDIENIKHQIANVVSSSEFEYRKLLKQRNFNVWNMANKEAVRWVKYPGLVKMFEGETPVYESEKDDGNISEILTVDHAFYIESPWRNMPYYRRNRLLSINDGFDFAEAQEIFIPDDELFAALGGSVVDKKDIKTDLVRPRLLKGSSMLTFKRTDGKGEYPLDECATGIKSFAILNFLYTRGLLNNRTLLIVDEPEAHLHPQWILEYAKVLVKLNRQLGVRLLLTTHSPDMLNAIRRVANVEEVPDLRFYLAKNDDLVKSLKYKYESLGRNVEPIFEAFNLAADKTESYPLDIK